MTWQSSCGGCEELIESKARITMVGEVCALAFSDFVPSAATTSPLRPSCLTQGTRTCLFCRT